MVVFFVVAEAFEPVLLLLLLVPLLLVAQAASPRAETAASAITLAAVPEVLKLGPPSDGARFGRIADDHDTRDSGRPRRSSLTSGRGQ